MHPFVEIYVCVSLVALQHTTATDGLGDVLPARSCSAERRRVAQTNK